MRLRLTLASALAALALAAPSRAADVLTTQTFDDFPGLSAPESSVNDAGPSGAFDVGGHLFNNHSDSAWGYWDGWAASNQTQPLSDDPSLDFLNQYLAAPEVDATTPNGYLIAFSPESVYGTSYAEIALADGQSAHSLRVANTLYSVQAMSTGDGWARAFDAGDYFRLAIRGLDATGAEVGAVIVTLADFTSADPDDWYIRGDWLTVDLTSLGADARTLRFDFESTDVDRNGEARTPLYAAIDDLTTAAPGAAVPEPSAWALLAAGSAGLLAARRARRRA